MLTLDRNLALNVVAILGLSALIGCENTSNGNKGGTTGADVGSVSLGLQAAPGVTINTFSYAITGPNSYMGTIDVTNSSTVSAIVGNVAAANGYSLAVNGTSTDGQTTCSGSAGPFNVTAGSTITVSVAIDCHRAHSTGSILVNGVINVCPSISSVSAAPPVGNTIALGAVASDPDNGPQPLTYTWTTGAGGTLSSTTAQNPTLTCTAPGLVSLNVSVSDGDAGCQDSYAVQVACPPDSALAETAWVEIGANNQAIARLLTPYNVCPSITVDSVTSPMTVRVLAGTSPLRTTSTDTTLMAAMTSGNSKASVFSTTVCEFPVPAGAVHATVAGIALPLPKPVVNRVVIVGDTGCRISIGNPYQACGDPTQWPFSVISSAGAAMQPDLVLHVGDYEYRDNPCPPGNTACAGQPWGYGSDAWMADFFTPAAPLLKAAPWVIVRGNHEVCNRAGQGWYRYLDPAAYDATGVKTCNDPNNDNTGNYNDPWAVSFGDTQFIAFDSSNAAKSAYNPANQQPYTAELMATTTLASNTSLLSMFAVHHPILGYSAGSPPTLGNVAMQSVMNYVFPGSYYPPNIAVALHGHVHDFQAVNFSSNHPATFVAGNGGDNLDVQLPATGTFDPNTDLPAPGTAISSFAFSENFGFMVMDRVGAVGQKNWKFTSYRTDGTIIAVCTMAPPVACSGTCDPTPGGSQISCTDVNHNAIGLYQNIP